MGLPSPLLSCALASESTPFLPILARPASPSPLEPALASTVRVGPVRSRGGCAAAEPGRGGLV